MQSKGDQCSRPPLPYSSANILSRWTYTWIAPLLASVKRGGLSTTAHLYDVPPWLSTTTNAAKFQRVWNQKEASGRGWIYLVVAFAGWWFWWSGLLALGADLLQAQGADLMSAFISQLKERSKNSLTTICITAGLLVAASLLRKLFLNQSLFILSTTAYMIRAGSMGALFSHLLLARPHWSLGSGLNRLSIDTNRICTMLLYGHLVWSCPLRILLVFRTTLQMLGIPALYGIAFILIAVCSLFWLAHRMRAARRELARLSDERLQLTSDALKSMRTIKSLNLESIWIERIDRLRHLELRGIRRLNTLFAVSASLNFWSPVMATTITIVAAVLYETNLEASRVFSAARAFQSLMVPLWMLPMLVNRAIAASVSANRIDQMLRSEVVVEKHSEATSSATSPSLDLIDASFLAKDKQPLFQTVSLSIKQPGLYGVTGSVASGKSFLLAALAKVIPLHSGDYYLNCPTVGYCPFPAWIRNGTVQDNIVFDRPLNADEVERVMRAVALWGELDPTKVVGEGGSAISGGQRQRVSLARALYGRPSLLLVDDLLTSLDVNVAAHIWQSCFAAGNAGNADDSSIRLLVTNDERRLEQCDFIITIDQCKLFVRETEKEKHKAECPPISIAPPPLTIPTQEAAVPVLSVSSYCTDDVHRETSMKLINRFITAAGGIAVLLLLFTVVLSTDLTKLERDKCLKERLHTQNLADPMATRSFLLAFIGWGSLQGILTAGSNILAMYLCYRASLRIHDDALRKIMLAKLSVLETTATGRLLTRLGRDMEILDYNLPEKLISMMGCFSTILCTVLAIAQLIPWLLPSFILPLLWVVWLQQGFSRLWRALLRLTGMTLAPVTGLLLETVAGMSIIRAFKQCTTTVDRLFVHLDNYTMCSFLSISSRRWISLRGEIGASVYLAGLIAYCITKQVDSADVGMLLMYALSGAESIDWFIKHLAEMDQFMVSIERISFYADSLEGESIESKNVKITGESRETMKEITPSQATAASIEFDQVSVAYAGGMTAIWNVSLLIAPRQKIAIVGRTGVGKSSLVAALIRLVDYQGIIRLDGVDVKSLSLFELRTRITSVLQEPALFGHCSLRDNLDPHCTHTDVELWTVLDTVGLCSLVKCLPDLLESTTFINGLSTGQRQLICLARALLVSPKILVLDEATSPLDTSLEMDIHRQFLSSLTDTTIITVTHKLDITQLYDRVILMEDGKIAEDGRPSALLSEPNSKFAQLCRCRPS